jgi:Fur family ferric uptake transcriptional regulator
MPAAGRSPPVSPPEIPTKVFEPLCAVFRRALKGEGLKYTPERAAILDMIVRFDGLFDADQLLDAMRKTPFRVSKATVYRTLKLLQDSGIVQQVLFDQTQAHYQLAYGQTPCDLLILVDQGQVQRVEIPELGPIVERLCRERGLEPRGHRMTIFAGAPVTSPVTAPVTPPVTARAPRA